MMKIIVFALMLISAPLWGLSLDEAKSKGWIKELPTGYIQATNPQAKSLEGEINAKRKSAYEKVAKKTGATVDQVGAQMAAKIKAKK